MKEWELLVEKRPLPGSLNMAVDEYLFRSPGLAPQTCVRFYQWERPTASLGYSQVAEKAVDLDFCRQQGVDVVRRITGGKLVLHHREVTYSVTSSDVRVFSPTVAESYRLISCALIRGLKEMGLEARLAGPPPSSYGKGNLPCFSYPARNEVEIAGRKIIGSAQKRVGPRFLQHGSILLESDAELLRRVAAPSGSGNQLRLVSLSEALRRSVGFGRAVENLKRGFEGYFGVRFKPKVFSPEELEIIQNIEKTKYGTEDWTLRRKEQKTVDFFIAR
ncbi:MAG: lipoate--protein ligase family protein [Candidatus Aminicenantes bacterium]|nr:lipoate--protein ligase family protein [Candidatus Aminicenantes bacterium]